MEDDLKRNFPKFNLEGKVNEKEEAIVTADQVKRVNMGKDHNQGKADYCLRRSRQSTAVTKFKDFIM